MGGRGSQGGEKGCVWFRGKGTSFHVAGSGDIAGGTAEPPTYPQPGFCHREQAMTGLIAVKFASHSHQVSDVTGAEYHVSLRQEASRG